MLWAGWRCASFRIFLPTQARYALYSQPHTQPQQQSGRCAAPSTAQSPVQLLLQPVGNANSQSSVRGRSWRWAPMPTGCKRHNTAPYASTSAASSLFRCYRGKTTISVSVTTLNCLISSTCAHHALQHHAITAPQLTRHICSRGAPLPCVL